MSAYPAPSAGAISILAVRCRRFNRSTHFSSQNILQVNIDHPLFQKDHPHLPGLPFTTSGEKRFRAVAGCVTPFRSKAVVISPRIRHVLFDFLVLGSCVGFVSENIERAATTKAPVPHSESSCCNSTVYDHGRSPRHIFGRSEVPYLTYSYLGSTDINTRPSHRI